ncbi:unnamed protein product, partial [Ectocarpus sp. 12 AP-2014]
SLSLPYTYVFRGRPGREFRDQASIFFIILRCGFLSIFEIFSVSPTADVRGPHRTCAAWKVVCQCAGGGGEYWAASTRRARRCAGWLCWALRGCSAGPRLLSGEGGGGRRDAVVC